MRVIYAENSGRYYNAPERAALRAGVMARQEDLDGQPGDKIERSKHHVRPLGAKALLGAVRPPR